MKHSFIVQTMRVAGLVLLSLAALTACNGKTGDTPATTATAPLTTGPYPALLVAQAQFITDEKTGDPAPGPALLLVLQKTPAGWHTAVLEDPRSNVFHKAMFFRDAQDTCILTIGASEAALKLWRHTDSAWQAQILWAPVFGGTWNRLRDIEIGDVTGDGRDNLVIATHDQGVVAVGTGTDPGWTVAEIDREPEIFVHEIEIGDVDGDGLQEFFATPSHPNKAAGGPQSGSVVMYKWNGSAFGKQVIDSSEKTHVKEILAHTPPGAKKATLYAVFEAETRRTGSSIERRTPVTIKSYRFGDNNTITPSVVATMDDFQCRFLCPVTLGTGTGMQLVAATMRSGLWLLTQTKQGWEKTLIDAESSGYEHAVYPADLDGDGVQELYVAADDQQELRCYRFTGTSFSKTVICPIPGNRITWNITAGKL